jgi:hypothetical protein
MLMVALVAGLAAPCGAQIVRGTVRASSTLLPLERAQVTARDSVGQMLAVATSGPAGDYAFRMPARVPFSVEVRRLGYAMGSTTVEPLLPADTAVVEFIMTEVAAVADAVTIMAEPGMNDRRLAEAQRSGWKVYEPHEIMQHREKSRDFFQLLRSLGSPGLIIPRNINDCVRSTRNNRCLTYIVDGQVLGPSANILPTDIYFMAVLSSSQSSMQYGDRAPWGALYLITRSALDRVQPDRPPRRAARPAPTPTVPPSR